MEARAIPGTEGASRPFWSPDSQFLALGAQGKLRKVPAAGGPVQDVADAPGLQGGTWNSDGVILFAPDQLQPLYRVPASGGTPSRATTLDAAGGEISHGAPRFLPDGRHFLYTATGDNLDESWIRVGELDSPETRPLLRSNTNAVPARGAGGDYILFSRDGTLMAQRFDTGALQMHGEPVPVSDEPVAGQVTAGTSPQAAFFSVSGNGLLSYLPGSQVTATRLTWLDRSGRFLESVGPAAWYEHVELAPDANRVAVGLVDQRTVRSDIHLLDFRDGTQTRFTFRPARLFRYPRWSPDGQRLIFSGAGPAGIYVKPSTGAGNEELVYNATDGARIFPGDWSPDARFVVFRRLLPGTTGALWMLSLDDRQATAVPQAEDRGTNGRFSPDGRWLAYQTSETGTAEVYVQPFPPTGAKWLVSRDGGVRPRWRRDGREMYYVSSSGAANPGGSLMAVPVVGGETWRTGTPIRLFDVRSGTTAVNTYPYDVARDGQRFLVITPPEEAEAPVTVVLNWETALER